MVKLAGTEGIWHVEGMEASQILGNSQAGLTSAGRVSARISPAGDFSLRAKAMLKGASAALAEGEDCPPECEAWYPDPKHITWHEFPSPRGSVAQGEAGPHGGGFGQPFLTEDKIGQVFEHYLPSLREAVDSPYKFIPDANFKGPLVNMVVPMTEENKKYLRGLAVETAEIYMAERNEPVRATQGADNQSSL